MYNNFTDEPMLNMYVFETEQLLEQLEQLILNSEKSNGFTKESIDEIFRIMHTIKGSSAMMMFNGISALTHSIEDLFYFFRNHDYDSVDCSEISDLVLEGVDFIKEEIKKIKNGHSAEGNPSDLIDNINKYVSELSNTSVKQCQEENTKVESGKQQYYIQQAEDINYKAEYAFKAVLSFEDDCEMENIRAYAVIHNLEDIAYEVNHIPEDLFNNELTVEKIKQDGFKIFFRADLEYAKMQEVLLQTVFLKELELTELTDEEFDQFKSHKNLVQNDLNKTSYISKTEKPPMTEKETQLASGHQSILSVDVSKLDKLMDLVGEMVIAEAMVIHNPDLNNLELDNFQKAAQHLDKITKEMQDMVMSIRMVSLTATFQKMNRIVRDMCKKLDKEAELIIIGEETEVDKNIIEHISDPLMHLVRNALDHGMESAEERKAMGKPKTGAITLEAKSAGSDVLIIVRDDGNGLNKEKIFKKAQNNGLIYKTEYDMTDREIYNLILLPGFSTKDDVTEFSGRGVGMDVVAKNIESIGGSVSVDSTPNVGTTITLKIPLTLAIIDGMNIKVGNCRYTLPTISIKQSFRPKADDTFTDPEGNEMIMVRGNCYPILRLHQYYRIPTEITEFVNGIIIMVEQDEKTLCVFADELLGEQQIVVKTLPKYIRNFKKVKGLAGCTLLGDGSISLILDIGGLMHD